MSRFLVLTKRSAASGDGNGQRADSRVLMRMLGRVYLLPVAVLASPVVVS